MKISYLIAEIQNNDLVLPEFQREYVWTLEKAKQLLISLWRNYPVGSLLFWKTDNPPHLKNIAKLPDKLGTVRVILDGQQRLTTLYMLITGEIPPYYTENDIGTDPRELYFNLNNGDFQYYQESKMKGNKVWWSVTECFNNMDINIIQIAQDYSNDNQEALDLVKKYNDNLNKLRNIKEIDLPEQTVPNDAGIDEAINIFDRVNSQGTKLTDAELALTHITGKWPQARSEMKKEISILSRDHFYFDLTFLTRCLTGVVSKRALFEYIHKVPKERLINGWGQLKEIIAYLVSILPSWAKIHSSEDVNTTNAFVPLIIYLSLNQGKFPDERSIKEAVHWLYAALLWSRYTAQTDQKLERDVSLIMRHDNPWKILNEQIIDHRGRIEIKSSDLEGRGAQHPLFKMTYVLSKTHESVDFFTGAPLGTVQAGKSYKVLSHYLFAPSVLYKNGFESDNHLHRKWVNEVANRIFVTCETKRNAYQKPEEYLPMVEENYPGSLKKQFIPLDPQLWRVDKFKDFLVVRRKLIAKKINEYMNALISEPEIVHELPVEKLIQMGESATLEFKSTLQWDVIKNERNRQLQFSVLKTIAAFLNSEGGTLIIGVEDNGNVIGLNRDYALLSKKNRDGFEQKLVNILSEYIGVEYARLIKIRFDSVEGKDVCIVDIDRSQDAVFISNPKGVQFFVRHGNTTRLLDSEETNKYIQMNWE